MTVALMCWICCKFRKALLIFEFMLSDMASTEQCGEADCCLSVLAFTIELMIFYMFKILLLRWDMISFFSLIMCINV